MKMQTLCSYLLTCPRRLTLSLAFSVFLPLPTFAVVKTLSGHVPSMVNNLNLQPSGRLRADRRLNLAIGLPLHNKQVLSSLVDQMYEPAAPGYHHFLSLDQFTEKFGPTKQEYETVVHFAETNGLQVFATYSNRLVLDVVGTVSDIEKAFNIFLQTYQHPTEPRQFFAPDREPTVDSTVPILNVSGLENFALSHPNLHMRPATAAAQSVTSVGSAPDGSYQGSDFRRAYAPGTSLDGSGQIIGLFEEDGYDPTDITIYELQAGLRQVPLQNILLDGFSGIPSSNSNNVGEVCLDIEMAVSMAPGLSKVVVFEGNNWDDILNSMASHPEIKQFSSSWGSSGGEDSTMQNVFLQMAAQGQSFFLASGDGDAFPGALSAPDDDTHITTVGGTTLTMNSSGASYSSETVWNWHYNPPAWPGGGNGYWGSGGGISTSSAIPSYQQWISMASNAGSTSQRNVPDVALTADQVWVIYFSGRTGSFGGTSCAAPLWAGFTALVNQQAAANGLPAIGFLNPALYRIAQGPAYASCFHDITTGNNTSGPSPTRFYAVAGYDLCTGLGTPNGTNLINALLSYDGYSGAVWVDYNYSGHQNGSYDSPYNTFAQGVTAVSPGGSVWFRTAGSKVETMTITKPMRVSAIGGPATIGH
jgi:subtilase family serine protease